MSSNFLRNFLSVELTDAHGLAISDSLFLRGIALSICLGSLALVLHTALLVYSLHTPVPWGDMITEYRWLSENGLQFRDLFRPGNEHIIFFPRLFYLIDIYFFSASSSFLVTVNFSLAVIIPFYLYSVAKRHFFMDHLDALLYLFVTLAAYSNGRHLLNYVFGYMVQHWLVNITILVFAYFFAKLVVSSNSKENKKFSLALFLLAFIAVFTSGNGILCLVTSVLLGLLLRLKWKMILGFSILMILFIVVYKSLNPLASADFTILLKKPVDSLKFYFAFLGAPYLRYHVWPADSVFWEFDPCVAIARGTLLFVLAALLSARLLWKRKGIDIFSIFHIFIILIVFETGILTVVSRISLDVFEGTNSKYANTVLLAWISVFSLGMKTLADVGALSHTHRIVAWFASFLVVLSMALPAHAREEKIFRQWNNHLWETASFLLASVYDRDHYLLYHDPKAFFMVSQDFLRPHKFTIFGRYKFKLGDSLSTHFTIDKSYPCLFSFDEVQPLILGATKASLASGWAWDQKNNRPIHEVILVDASGAIIGVAYSTQLRQDVVQYFKNPAMSWCGWRGVTQPVDIKGPISAFGVIDSSGCVCFLGSR
jgi:hypothetical protein